jgi:hypothetical protein
MNVRKIGPKDEPIDTVEINYHSLSARQLMKYLEKLPSLEITEKRFLPMTDDLWIGFEYKGFKFLVETPFVDYWVRRESEDCPESVFREIVNHLRSYKLSVLRTWLVEISEKRRAELKSRFAKN